MSNPQEYKALIDISAECAIMPLCYRGGELIFSSRVTEGPQQLIILEAETSLSGNEGQKPPL